MCAGGGMHAGGVGGGERHVCLEEGWQGVHAQGVCRPSEVSMLRGSPVNRMTDACENITLPQTLFVGSN